VLGCRMASSASSPTPHSVDFVTSGTRTSTAPIPAPTYLSGSWAFPTTPPSGSNPQLRSRPAFAQLRGPGLAPSFISHGAQIPYEEVVVQ
jgi:hypothetical protein